MEMEEIQALWSEMSDGLEQQKKLTNEIIMNMTQERYRNKFRTISTYETIGTVICFAMAMYIMVNFGKLDTWYLMACGIFTLAFLIVLPILVLKSLRRIRNLNIIEKNYKETLVSYSKARKNLMTLQQFGIYASYILMFAASAVFSKVWSNKDFFIRERNIWAYAAIVVAIVFVFVVSRWGYRSYKNITNAAENILKELE